MRLALAILVCVLCASCSTAERKPTHMQPAGDPHFSVEEQRIVAAARAYLEKTLDRRLDARYQVKHAEYGYEVSARFVTGYQDSRPLYYSGEPGVVFLSADGTVLKFMPGSARVGP